MKSKLYQEDEESRCKVRISKLSQKSLDIDDESRFAFTVRYLPKCPSEYRKVRGTCVGWHESCMPGFSSVFAGEYDDSNQLDRDQGSRVAKLLEMGRRDLCASRLLWLNG